MRTSALATTAPLESCTVPVMAPVAPPWAKVMPTSEIASSAQQRNLLTDLDIHPSPEKRRVCFRYRLGTMKGQDLKQRDEPALPDCKIIAFSRRAVAHMNESRSCGCRHVPKPTNLLKVSHRLLETERISNPWKGSTI